jgi:hypothetical protein
VSLDAWHGRQDETHETTLYEVAINAIMLRTKARENKLEIDRPKSITWCSHGVGIHCKRTNAQSQFSTCLASTRKMEKIYYHLEGRAAYLLRFPCSLP